MQCANMPNLFHNLIPHGIGQHCYAIFTALASVDSNGPARDIQVAHPQAQTLHGPKPTAIKQPHGQLRVATTCRQQALSLSTVEYHWNPAFGLGAHNVIEPGQINFQHMPIQE